MHLRMRRLALLGVLLTSGAAAGFALWTIERNARQLAEQREAKEATIERLLTAISAITTAQQAYADHASADLASFTRVSLQVDQLTTDAAGLRAAAESGASSERLEEFWTALSALMSAETRARELLAGGDKSAAAEVILASAREHVSALNSSLRAFREVEAGQYRRARTARFWQFWVVLGLTAGVWAIGLIAFAVSPLRASAPVRMEGPTPARPALDLPLVPPAVSDAIEAAPALDLATAATLSSEVARLTDLASLQALLARAADALGASGVIVWMGAGDSLVAAEAHGYDAAVLRRIPSIPRDADNATAVAWRTGQPGTVPADASGRGAIVAPMACGDGCVGVFAAEVHGGRERDAATCAVAAILASQLAGVLAEWSAASTADRQVNSLDRKAAAS
jgi:hypothetical protein